jgi:hypothetical protein
MPDYWNSEAAAEINAGVEVLICHWKYLNFYFSRLKDMHAYEK